MKFPDFIHSQERMPDTGLRSNNMQWDFWTLSPESAHQVMILMSDRGTPRTYRHMNGYSSSTYLWENAAGKKVWVKYHFKTEQGIQNFTDAEARNMRSEDLDCHQARSHEAIARKDYPAWRLEVQIMPFEDAASYRFNPFDLTKVLAAEGLPDDPDRADGARPKPGEFLRSDRAVGVRGVELCPGHRPSPDRMVLGRMFAYGDSKRYRNGANYAQLPVNRPLDEAHNYNKDGPMRYRHSGNQPSMRRTATAVRGPTRSATAIQAGSWRAARSCARPTRRTRTTTTLSSPACSTGR